MKKPPNPNGRRGRRTERSRTKEESFRYSLKVQQFWLSTGVAAALDRSRSMGAFSMRGVLVSDQSDQLVLQILLNHPRGGLSTLLLLHEPVKEYLVDKPRCQLSIEVHLSTSLLLHHSRRVNYLTGLAKRSALRIENFSLKCFCVASLYIRPFLMVSCSGSDT